MSIVEFMKIYALVLSMCFFSLLILIKELYIYLLLLNYYFSIIIKKYFIENSATILCTIRIHNDMDYWVCDYFFD